MGRKCKPHTHRDKDGYWTQNPSGDRWQWAAAWPDKRGQWRHRNVLSIFVCISALKPSGWTWVDECVFKGTLHFACRAYRTTDHLATRQRLTKTLRWQLYSLAELLVLKQRSNGKVIWFLRLAQIILGISCPTSLSFEDNVGLFFFLLVSVQSDFIWKLNQWITIYCFVFFPRTYDIPYMSYTLAWAEGSLTWSAFGSDCRRCRRLVGVVLVLTAPQAAMWVPCGPFCQLPRGLEHQTCLPVLPQSHGLQPKSNQTDSCGFFSPFLQPRVSRWNRMFWCRWVSELEFCFL